MRTSMKGFFFSWGSDLVKAEKGPLVVCVFDFVVAVLLAASCAAVSATRRASERRRSCIAIGWLVDGHLRSRRRGHFRI